jgi:hypothetical protein
VSDELHAETSAAVLASARMDRWASRMESGNGANALPASQAVATSADCPVAWANSAERNEYCGRYSNDSNHFWAPPQGYTDGCGAMPHDVRSPARLFRPTKLSLARNNPSTSVQDLH